MIKVGVVGFGGLGHLHANTVWGLDNAKITAVCDINPAQLERKEVEFNIKQDPNEFEISTANTYLDAKEMLEKEDLDAVVVALPTYIHAEYAVMAMSYGCHVICEKPMAMNPEECDKMIEARDKYGKHLMIAQCIRFWPEYEYLYDVLKTQPFGKFHSLVMHRVGAYPARDPNDWFLDHNRSGGALLDLHVHDMDFAQYALGNPEKLYAVGVRGHTGGIDDHTAIMSFADESAVTIRCSWMQSAGFSMSYLAIFEDATLLFDASAKPTLQLTRRGSSEFEAVDFEPESAYVREMKYFLECVEGKHENTKCTAESSRNAIRLVKEAEKIILGK